jgi:3-hydroxybutyryl-CoA dehydrogenase
MADDQSSVKVARLGVIGAGQMGGGIAQVAAAAGIDVTLVDANAELAARGKARIAEVLAKVVQKGKMTAGERDALLERIRPSGTMADLGGAHGCDFCVEAATENESLKLTIFKDADGVLPAHAILASNTSSIPITKLAAVTKRPGRVIGMHFMNPVPLMKLVEIIRAIQTDDETYAVTRALAERLGKTTVTSKDVPGFIINRVLIPLLNEACFALYEGIGTAEDIDKGVELGLNHPMGPLRLADLVGLDTCLAIAEVLHRELGDDKYRPCPLLRTYVAAGWLGRKTGRGFYTY